MEIFRRLGKRTGLQNSYYNIGQVERLLGRRDAARQYLQRAAEISRDSFDPRSETRNRVELVFALVDSRELDLAAVESERALRIAVETGDVGLQVFANMGRAVVAFERGEVFDFEIVAPEAAAALGAEFEAASLIAHCLHGRRGGGAIADTLSARVSAVLEQLCGIGEFLLRFELLLASGADVGALANAPWGGESAGPILRARAERIGDESLRRRFSAEIAVLVQGTPRGDEVV